MDILSKTKRFHFEKLHESLSFLNDSRRDAGFVSLKRSNSQTFLVLLFVDFYFVMRINQTVNHLFIQQLSLCLLLRRRRDFQGFFLKPLSSSWSFGPSSRHLVYLALLHEIILFLLSHWTLNDLDVLVALFARNHREQHGAVF